MKQVLFHNQTPGKGNKHLCLIPSESHWSFIQQNAS